MKKRVFLVHGWEGTPDNHWFPWLSWELKARGFEVRALTMPHADKPKVSEWVAEIKTVVGRPNKDTFFVAHSLGCIAVVRYLAELPKKSSPPLSFSPSPEEGERKKKKGAEVGGCVFVAGFLSSLGIPEIEEFCLPPQMVARGQNAERTRTNAEFFDKVKQRCDKFVTIFSDNDGYVSLEKSLEFQKTLGAKGILERGKGHFSKREGVDALPSVFKSIIDMSS